MSLPTVSGRGLNLNSADLSHSGARWQSFSSALSDVFRQGSMFYLTDHGIDNSLIEAVLAETAAFFAQSEEAKNAIHINKSKNQRGYGMMKNYRDWREQIHLALEENCDILPDSNNYRQLAGLNQWPESEGDKFRRTMNSYFEAVENIARNLLVALAQNLGREDDFFTARMKEKPYLLMKAMAYFPQENAGTQKSGVTAHCDWSWLTFLIQDNVGGLEAQNLKGQWQTVEPRTGAIVINTGELLEIESGGIYPAVPHRVVNASIKQNRYSVPLFINPALDSTILPQDISSQTITDNEHVHKVIRPGTKLDNFVFGESEYQRKIEGRWCHQEQCLVKV